MKPCLTCGHGKSAHHGVVADSITGTTRGACAHVGCGCMAWREDTASVRAWMAAAAAPELLAAAKAVIAQFDSGALCRNTDGDMGSDWAIKAMAPLAALAALVNAIAKAEGREP